MFRKLYFKLYFYIFISIISSISITSLYFYIKINYNKTNDLRGNGSKTSLLIRDEINKVKPFGKDAIHKRLHELNKHLDWTILYLENNKKRSKILNYISKQNQSEFVFLEYYTKKEKKNQKEKKYISINEKDIIRINLYLDF
ncbi:MAG: hypothetical protein ACK4IX_09375 [Candidatus Sericytochromatia bacterium]